MVARKLFLQEGFWRIWAFGVLDGAKLIQGFQHEIRISKLIDNDCLTHLHITESVIVNNFIFL